MTIYQRTLKQTIEVSGIGLHSGNNVMLKLIPAPANTGIVFRRVDLNPAVEIKAEPHLVRETTLCTGLVSDEGVRVQTIEHLMAAISSFGIDNLYVELNSPEVPVMDGSSAAFVILFQDAGLVHQEAPKKFYRITKKVRVEDGDKFAELVPVEGNKFNLDFTIDFNHPVFSKELSHFNMDLTTKNFVEQLSRCRTFGFLKDIEYLQQHGLCRGGSLANAIVLDENRIINEEGLRYNNEFVRHKMLDAIGDLFLCGHNLIGSYRAYKSGHHLNNLLVRKLLAEQAFEEVIFENNASEELQQTVVADVRVYA
ncbi:UDP-3-O-[3-hydroxymyristoyl] N-acetylglucosamine deacetylase [Psittacicella melopsittaci]|uniref:UDP-3-O-acyl-N-acetylglucosamine deacetylase n=1 Tax=Psittacicella melopsittaci TaxID=2028576 RepID=A0A3A1Y6T1_9GAMM|nr:UDP-3-O-acyl-N-acetylglucosamine deacetylase [Psittacicella melopsittaci]RIY32990.1 UDP-3-O-[3-hydroxymyristoyl] N-acetylglucosamine deacetylase [Psittacicella melopsittaci]